MRWTSSLVDTLRGSMGGRTASTSRGGVGYFRARVIPRNPRSLLQLASRAAVASAAVLWRTILTEDQQELWWDLATGSQTGQTLFSRANQPRIYAQNAGRTTGLAGGYEAIEIPAIITPPDSASTPLTTPTGVVIDASDNTLVLTANADDPYNAETLTTGQVACLLVYATHQQNASQFSRSRSYQMCAAICRQAGDPAIGSPEIDLSAFGFTTTTGKVMYLKFVALDHEGRASVPVEMRVPITA